MTTTTNLGKVHIFPTETSYTNNKSNIGSNDIALVKSSLMDELKGNTTPTLTALMNWDRMKALNGGTDVRNYSSTATGLKSYGGDSSFPDIENGTSRKGTILLKQSYTNFDKLLIISSSDSADFCFDKLVDVWEFQNVMNMGGVVDLMNETGLRWRIHPHTAPGLTPLSTETTWFIADNGQNSAIVEIYGVKY